MRIWDAHMHCHFSGDSDASPESMIASAMDKNLAGICFTDHLDYDYPNEPDAFLLDFESYEKKILSLQQEYDGIFPVNMGIEVGLQPHIADQNRQAVEAHPFDFVIGSSHTCDRLDPYYPSFYEGRTEEAAYRRYFESILENIDTSVDFDVYGHLDYVVRYGPNKNQNYSYEKYADVIDEILIRLIRRDKGIEVNTAGFKYGLCAPNPCPQIIRRYRELGGEILTIGADAHQPEHVGYAFDQIPALLKDCGFNYYTVFTARVPVFYKLPD